ncbi:MAG TPA: hypothetical protein VM489_13130 [Burkholderiales bacterium]|nr:hypothetical protein [Burkholderiales bacterium]
MRLARTLIALVAAGACAAALAQLRTIPEEARRGQLRHVHDMTVEIDGEARRLAPGAQIRDAWNRIVLPSAVPPGTAVRYLVDAQGHLRQIWILTPEEAARN